ncbi:non-heme ferritin [uncultured Ferrimonas sp.]|uniref:non-heme ferritin n=1 Tax=uncultured Ferrimonas sp. TaxID=432640 RepID=UPI0026342580|nr:non-heme ferritin [uncultured Ferrimonas sp.]
MLAAAMTTRLNEQINLEFFSSNLYLQMSAWCEDKGFEGAAEFLRAHADEEMEHMRRLFTYVSEAGGMPLLGAIDAPESQFESLHDVFVKTFEHEQLITKKINDLAHTAFANQDYSTFNFLQWYVAEQHEEEKLFKGVLDRIELVGNDGASLYLIDKELAQLATAEGSSVMQDTAE